MKIIPKSHKRTSSSGSKTEIYSEEHSELFSGHSCQSLSVSLSFFPPQIPVRLSSPTCRVSKEVRMTITKKSSSAKNVAAET